MKQYEARTVTMEKKPPMTLRELIEHADLGAVNIFNEAGKMYPIYHIVQRDGVHTIIPMPPIPKAMGVQLIRGLMSMLDAVAYVFIDEAWSIKRDRDWRKTNKGEVKDEPDRDEIIMYDAQSETEPSLHGTRLIDPVSRQLGPLNISQPKEIGGRMVNLLPIKRPSKLG